MHQEAVHIPVFIIASIHSKGTKLRLKNPDKLLNEMKNLKEKLGVKNFIFRDPVFSINKKHTIEI